MTAGPLDCTFALLDPLIRHAALIVESDYTLGRPRQIGHDEADARVQLAGCYSTLATTRRGLYQLRAQ